MTIEIPVWILWTLGAVLGVPAVAAILFFASIGIGLFRAFTPFR